MKKTVLRVNINCSKCKTEVLNTVTKLSGIDSIAVDGEKGTLTVIGDVDPVLVTKRLRKAKRVAEIISVGPPKKDYGKDEKPLSSCRECQLVAVNFPPYESGLCTIL